MKANYLTKAEAMLAGHGPTYPISDLSGSTITRGNCTVYLYFFTNQKNIHILKKFQDM